MTEMKELKVIFGYSNRSARWLLHYDDKLFKQNKRYYDKHHEHNITGSKRTKFLKRRAYELDKKSKVPRTVDLFPSV